MSDTTPTKTYRVCTRCVMDTSDPEICFNDAGVCNHCITYTERARRELPGEQEAAMRLSAIVTEMKEAGRGKDYDCIIGVSGGVDSTMVAYEVKRLGLRPLAVHFDNGWNDELAVKNIESCLTKLGMDLYTHVVDWDEFRDIQRSLFKASVPNVESATDHAIMALLFRIASKRGVRYVVSGGNIATEGIMPLSWMYDNRDLKNIASIHKQFGRVRMKTYPRSSLLSYFRYLFINRIRYVPILNYLKYNKQVAKDTIMRELGWRDYGGKHYESFFTKFFQSYYLPTKFNMDKRRPHLATLINSGQVTREEALRELERKPYDQKKIESDIAYFLKKMELSQAEWKEIMDAPPKKHTDYPCRRWLFRNKGFIQFVKRIARARSLQRPN